MSALYPNYKQLLLNGSIDMTANTIQVVGINVATDNVGGYNAAHTTMNDITSYSGITPQTLGTKTIASGVFDAANSVFGSLAADGTKHIEALIVYKFVDGTPANNDLIAYIDGFTTRQPNGGDINIIWDTNIFAL